MAALANLMGSPEVTATEVSRSTSVIVDGGPEGTTTKTRAVVTCSLSNWASHAVPIRDSRQTRSWADPSASFMLPTGANSRSLGYAERGVSRDILLGQKVTGAGTYNEMILRLPNGYPQGYGLAPLNDRAYWLPMIRIDISDLYDYVEGTGDLLYAADLFTDGRFRVPDYSALPDGMVSQEDFWLPPGCWNARTGWPVSSARRDDVAKSRALGFGTVRYLEGLSSTPADHWFCSSMGNGWRIIDGRPAGENTGRVAIVSGAPSGTISMQWYVNSSDETSHTITVYADWYSRTGSVISSTSVDSRSISTPGDGSFANGSYSFTASAGTPPSTAWAWDYRVVVSPDSLDDVILRSGTYAEVWGGPTLPQPWLAAPIVGVGRVAQSG